jgi:hypothetical protein
LSFVWQWTFPAPCDRAHAERLSESSDAEPQVTYNDIDEALGEIVGVANYLSSRLFYDTVLGSLVPTPQFNVMAELDQPWVKTENIPAPRRHWDEISESKDKWLEKAAIELPS